MLFTLTKMYVANLRRYSFLWDAHFTDFVLFVGLQITTLALANGL